MWHFCRSKTKSRDIEGTCKRAKLLILDEPTAVLTPQETKELFEQLLLLKQNGHTIIFISHKIKEVRQICDNITVLRGGKYVGTMPVANSTEEEISRFMVGRDVVLKVNKNLHNLERYFYSFKMSVIPIKKIKNVK